MPWKKFAPVIRGYYRLKTPEGAFRVGFLREDAMWLIDATNFAADVLEKNGWQFGDRIEENEAPDLSGLSENCGECGRSYIIGGGGHHLLCIECRNKHDCVTAYEIQGQRVERFNEKLADHKLRLALSNQALSQVAIHMAQLIRIVRDAALFPETLDEPGCK